MAESTGKKGGKQSIDSFADDLDSMLGVDEVNQQQVGMIDDDDAIDRLLMGGMFPEDENTSSDVGDADIDRLLEGVSADDHSNMTAGDGFPDDIDDLIAGFDINPKQQASAPESVLDDMPELKNDTDTDIADELLIDDFVAAARAGAGDAVGSRARIDEFEQMTEIDEFSDVPTESLPDNADFLLADFNISADDDGDLAPTLSSSPRVEQATRPAVELDDEPYLTGTLSEPPADADDDEFGDDDVDFVLSSPAAISIPPEAVPVPQVIEPEYSSEEDELGEPEIAEPVGVVETPPAQVVPAVNHSAELATLTAKIADLSKLLKQTRHDFEIKADKDEITACLESIDHLQTEQKKAKRNLDTVLSKKPIGVYVANGVAAVAILVVVGLWIDAFITKSQLEQLVEITGQLKQQVEVAPTADAADKELLRKQLDDLTVQQTIATTQLAELSKVLHGDGGEQKPNGDLGKQLSELSNQDMQMGEAIEALQSKVAALEKGKSPTAAPKPVAKKPVIEQNWAVNLIAFKQDWYAKRKAEEFAAKGVPAKVSRTDNKGETWYRLSVDGFVNQAEAAAFAAKVKKTLNLDSVWVAKNKD